MLHGGMGLGQLHCLSFGPSMPSQLTPQPNSDNAHTTGGASEANTILLGRVLPQDP